MALILFNTPKIIETDSVKEVILVILDCLTNRELSLDKPDTNIFQSMCGCFLMCKYPKMVTRIKVLRAIGLENVDKVGGKKEGSVLKVSVAYR